MLGLVVAHGFLERFIDQPALWPLVVFRLAFEPGFHVSVEADFELGFGSIHFFCTY